jgi:hypothetical protein
MKKRIQYMQKRSKISVKIRYMIKRYKIIVQYIQVKKIKNNGKLNIIQLQNITNFIKKILPQLNMNSRNLNYIF